MNPRQRLLATRRMAACVVVLTDGDPHPWMREFADNPWSLVAWLGAESLSSPHVMPIEAA